MGGYPQLLIGRWKLSEEATLHEEWFAETFCLCCGFPDVAGWRLAPIYIPVSGRRLACLWEAFEFVWRIRLMNLFSCQVCNQCLWLVTTVFTTMVLLQSMPVYLQQSCIYVFIGILLVQQLFTDECILLYLSHDGILQWSSKGGVKFETRRLCRYCRELYRCFGEDIT